MNTGVPKGMVCVTCHAFVHHDLIGYYTNTELSPYVGQTQRCKHLLEPFIVTFRFLVCQGKWHMWSSIMCTTPLQTDAHRCCSPQAIRTADHPEANALENNPRSTTWLLLCELHSCERCAHLVLAGRSISVKKTPHRSGREQCAGIQVIRQVLPVLQSLSEDSESAVQGAAIEGLAQVLPLHGSNPELAGRLYSHLDELVTNNQPQVSCIACTALTPLCGIPSCLDWKGMTKQICSRTEDTDSKVPPVVCSMCKQSCVQNVCFMASHQLLHLTDCSLLPSSILLPDKHDGMQRKQCTGLLLLSPKHNPSLQLIPAVASLHGQLSIATHAVRLMVLPVTSSGAAGATAGAALTANTSLRQTQ